MCLGKPLSMLHRSTLKISRVVFDTDPSKAAASICAVEHGKKKAEKLNLPCAVLLSMSTVVFLAVVWE